MARRLSAAQRLYRRFHRRNPDRAHLVDVAEAPEILVSYGRLVAVEYAPDEPTEHRGVVFRHEFGDYGDRREDVYPILATDPSGEHLFIVRGPSRFRVGERGIVG